MGETRLNHLLANLTGRSQVYGFQLHNLSSCSCVSVVLFVITFYISTNTFSIRILYDIVLVLMSVYCVLVPILFHSLAIINKIHVQTLVLMYIAYVLVPMYYNYNN